MTNSNTVCRNILDTQDVIKDQVLSILLERLVATNILNEEDCKELSQTVTNCVDTQTSSLIDRVLNEFTK